MDAAILEVIFLRLPITSLIYCRGVCRSWRTIIRGRKFIDVYTSQSLEAKRKCLIVHMVNTRGSNFLFIDRRHGPIPKSLTMRFSFYNLTEFNLIGSSNGILCLATSGNNSFTRFVCNPFLGEYIQLPYNAYRIEGQLVSLRSEFGFCLANQSYKILDVTKWRVKNEENCWEYILEVYVHRLGDSHWKRIDSEAPSLFLQHLDSVSLLNDVLHWVGKDSAHTIHVFDLVEDNFDTINGLEVDDNDGKFSIGVLGNCLSIMSTHWKSVDVWVMKQYRVEDSWEKTFVINLPRLNLYDFSVKVLDFHEEDELLILYDGDIGIYNVDREEFQRMYMSYSKDCQINIVHHSESLISLF